MSEGRKGGSPVDHDSGMDKALATWYRALFNRHPHMSFSVSLCLYIVLVIAGKSLGPSDNIFVILPVIAASASYGFWGGLISGAFGLPFNLLLFALIGRLDLLPASLPLAEIAGVLVGGMMGYLSDYFRRLTAEIQQRCTIEDSLRQALKEKDLLYREIHHRVKNNLNIVKSLIRLQSAASEDPNFREACSGLEQRIYAIALIHEGLYHHSDLSTVVAGDYVRTLLGNITEAFSGGHVRLHLDIEPIHREFSIDTAVPFGLILNEVVTNAYKYAFDGIESPEISVFLRECDAEILLEVRDNGHGFEEPGRVGHGLGLRLVSVLSHQLRGIARFDQDGGTRFILSFPVVEPSYNS